MAETTTIHKNDSGVLFLCTIYDENGSPVNLSSVESVELYFRKPSGNVVMFPLEIVGDATRGFVRYVSGVNDFNEVGRWRSQIIVRFASDSIRHSSLGYVTVEDNIVT